jgi:hypothetical protein
MKALDLFMPYVLPYVAGCPSATAEQALRESAFEFCDLTLCVQAVCRVAAIADEDAYPVDSKAQQLPIRLVEAFYGDRPLTSVAIDEVDNASALTGNADGGDVESGTPVAAFIRNGLCEVGVYPPPNDPVDAKGFVFRVAYAPLRTATSLDDRLYDLWLAYITAGAVARLQEMPGQSFSADPMFMRTRFLQGVSRARADARRGRIVSSMRVNGPRFVGGRA